ncbi:MAG: preprotein translocase subunit SecG [Ruminococcaceae bacterium]|nr:preprotein translocase subunit SecG [Oscillospiraceae bacterium]
MLTIVCGIILIVAAVFLVVAVLLQNGKSHGLSGAISGGAETFFGKTKGKTIDRVLSKATTVVAIVFVILVILVYVFQKDYDYDNALDDYLSGAENGTVTDVVDPADTEAGETTAAAEESAAPAETTVAPAETTAAA